MQRDQLPFWAQKRAASLEPQKTLTQMMRDTLKRKHGHVRDETTNTYMHSYHSLSNLQHDDYILSHTHTSRYKEHIQQGPCGANVQRETEDKERLQMRKRRCDANDSRARCGMEWMQEGELRLSQAAPAADTRDAHGNKGRLSTWLSAGRFGSTRRLFGCMSHISRAGKEWARLRR